MFDIYLSHRRDYLLVVPKGLPIPSDKASGKWRKKRTGTGTVSDEIRSAVEKDGFYRRRLRDAGKQTHFGATS